MPPQAVTLAAGFARVAPVGRWAEQTWRPVSVAPDGEHPAGAEHVCSPLELRLFSDEADNYLLNLTAPQPMLFVVWRLEGNLPTVLMVTASYGEAARMLDAGENVEGIPLPEDLVGWIEDFARHHFRPPEKKAKQKRYASTRQEQRG